MRGIVNHHRSKAIADELGLSPKTVDGYIAEAIMLLGGRDRADAARRYKLLFQEQNAPEVFPPGFVRVEDAPAEPAAIEPQPASETPTGRGLERLTPLHRIAIIVACSLAIAFGLGLASVAVVGWLSVWNSAPRSSNQ